MVYEKKVFYDVCNENGMSDIQSNNAWKLYLELKNIVFKFWDDIELIAEFDDRDRSLLRNQCAESGVEWTPYEVDSILNSLFKIKKFIEKHSKG